MWDFETDPEFAAKLEWMDRFVTEKVEPLDQVIDHAWDTRDPIRNALIKPLQDEVRAQGLWACHLGPELGGEGYGQLQLALMNEILGRSHSGPVVFGCHAPDSGNAEILAHFGTPELKKKFLEPLLANDIVSAYSMTEPTGGSDPTGFKTQAHLDGDEWVINGEKWFSSHASFSTFLVVMAVTDPEAAPQKRNSMFIVPTDTPGVEIVRNVRVWGHHSYNDGTHAYVRYTDVRIPKDQILGEPGQGFEVAQVRLGGGRIHHAMRTVGLVKRAFEMMLERAVSRETKGAPLAHKQLVQAMIADSWMEIEQYRLLLLRTAWKIDKIKDYKLVRADISAVKALMPKVLHDVVSRAIQVHGSLGVSTELPFGKWLFESYHMALADGATEVHKVQLARELLKGVEKAPDMFPSRHVPRVKAAAEAQYAEQLAAAKAAVEAVQAKQAEAGQA